MDDPFAWLEDIDGDAALAWVTRQSARTEADIAGDALFGEMKADDLAVLEADDRVPVPSRHGDRVLNFWRDSSHRRGVLRRTSWESFRGQAPDWEILLDVDALAVAEGEPWVFKGASVRRPDRRRALVELSPGGSDTSVTREFDLEEARFVPPEEGGFVRPAGKGSLRWIDDDTVYVANDFGPGSVTASGYPRTIRRWARGTALADAPVVFEGEGTDVGVDVDVETLPGHPHHLFTRMIDFYRSRRWVWREGGLVEIVAPDDATVTVRERWALIRLRTPWTVAGRTFAEGSLLASDLEEHLAGRPDPVAVFEPTPTTSLSDHAWTRHHLVLSVQEDVRDRIEVADPGDGWRRRPLPGAPDTWTTTVMPVDSDVTDDVFLLGRDFTTPLTLYLGGDGPPEVIRAAPARFDASGLAVSQHFTASADGTRVPYFLVGPADADAPGPTLLTGYGGFEVSYKPEYSGIVGRSWLARGGRYAVANIRGGGEYGPAWHAAALRENRHRAYEDFEAVAEDLVRRSVTTPGQLGIMGGSNGGLLVGNMFVRRPELFGAVVCRVPLLDMKRYSHLLAGASWMAEYGDPDDPADWEFLRTFSPYHLLQPGQQYPPILLMTSTRDDRVHPGHARKMAAALGELGGEVHYWENQEGGHAGAADALQEATASALAYTFLHRRLG